MNFQAFNTRLIYNNFQGWLVLADGRQIQVEYAKNEMPSGNPKKGDMDWICCNVRGFLF